MDGPVQSFYHIESGNAIGRLPEKPVCGNKVRIDRNGVSLETTTGERAHARPPVVKSSVLRCYR
jgi:hypothetical protein